MSRQNVRSKANPGRDGKPRSTDAKGFKQARPREHRSPTERPFHTGGLVPAGTDVATLLDAGTSPSVKNMATRFARATDLTQPASAPVTRVQATAEGPLSPGDWIIAVALATDGRCAVTGDEATSWDDDGFEGHHVIPKTLLKKQGLYGWVWDERNGLYLRADVHGWYTDASARCIPRECLRPDVWRFAADLDEFLSSTWATDYLLEHYPLVGAPKLAELRSPTPTEPT